MYYMKLNEEIMIFDDGDCVRIYDKFLHKLSRVNKMIFKYLKDMKDSGMLSSIYDDLSIEQINTLIENGILIDDDDSYLSRKFTKDYQEPSKNLNTAYLHLTMKCNLACEYCYMRENLSHNKPYLSTSKWISVLLKLKNEGVQNIIFTGGEIFLHEGIFDIVKYAKELGFELTLLTNGTLIYGDKLDLVEYVDKVIISLDGISTSKRKGSENYSTLENILNAHKKISVRAVAVRGFEEEVAELKDLLLSQGVSHSSALCLPSCNDEICLIPDYDNYSLVGDIAGGNCGAGSNIIALDAMGNIYPCQTLVKKEFLIANIFDNDWVFKFQCNNLRKIINSFIPTFSSECQECIAINFCEGGCRSIAYEVYGDFSKRSEFLCDYYRKVAIERIRKEGASL